MTFSKIHSAGIITAFAIRSSNHKSSVNWYSCSHWRISGRKWNCFWLILQRVFFSLKDNLRSALHKFGKKRPYFLEVLIRTNHTQSVTGYFFILEWTSTITKYLRDQLNKLSDFYHQSFQRMSADVESAQKQWHYTVRLTDWLYEVSTLNIPLCTSNCFLKLISNYIMQVG